jgi:hypothetical protein
MAYHAIVVDAGLPVLFPPLFPLFSEQSITPIRFEVAQNLAGVLA